MVNLTASGLFYTRTHSWLARPWGALTETPLRTGVTPWALHGLDVVAAELPSVRSRVNAGLPCAVLWTSAGTAIKVQVPISGVVTMINPAVHADAHVVGVDPLGAGWLFAVLPSRAATTSALLSVAQYRLVLTDSA